MGQYTYERPREKLQYRGVEYLTTSELFQLVVGSGNSKVSGAKLAKKIVEATNSSRLVTLDELIKIDGIGMAKACQVLAVIELGRRKVASKKDGAPSSKTFWLSATRELVSAVRQTKHSVVGFAWFDGSQQYINYKLYNINKNEHYQVVGQRIFKDALAIYARSISVVIKVGQGVLTPDTTQLSLVKYLQDTGNILHIKVHDVWACNRQETARWGGEV